MNEDDFDAVRLTAGSRGWKVLVEAFLKRAEGERNEMYALDTTDDRRREIAIRQRGREDVLTWYQQQIERGGRE